MSTPAPLNLDALAERIDAFLLRLGVDTPVSPDGYWLVRMGSTAVVVSIFEHEGRPFARFAAIVLVSTQTSLELLSRLLRLNHEVIFGSFQLFDDQTVAFTHTLHADRLDFESFEEVLRYVGRVGDDHDEDLQALAGGARAEDIFDGTAG